jgi:hypothetical protein
MTRNMAFNAILFAQIALWAASCGTVLADQTAINQFTVKGTRIFYVVQGQGEPVVLIHGLYSSAGINWVWPGTMAALAKDHRVVAMDLPGHGLSDKPEGPEAYGMQMVEDIVALMDHLEMKKANIVGYSLGGMIAMKLTVTHPERVTSCCLGGMGWLRDGSYLQKFWKDMKVSKSSPVPAACLHGFGEFAVTEEQIKAVRVPVGMLVGDKDPCKALYVAPLAAIRKDWPVVEIKDVGHLDCIVKKDFIDDVVKWVSQFKADGTVVR